MNPALCLAPNPDLLDPVLFDDEVGVDEIARGRLAGVARRHDIVLGVFTDEEMILCGDDPDSAGDPHWTPYVDRLSADEACVATLACARWLESYGMVNFGDEGHIVAEQPHLTIAWAVANATSLVTYRADVRGEPSRQGGVFVLPEGLVLHDQISVDVGLHELVLRNRQREAAWLAALLDPTARATATSEAQVAADPSDLVPAVTELARMARSSTVMAAVGATAAGAEEQAVTAYGAEDGLWLFQGRRGEGGGAILQRLGDEDVLGVAGTLLSVGDGTPRSKRFWRRASDERFMGGTS